MSFHDDVFPWLKILSSQYSLLDPRLLTILNFVEEAITTEQSDIRSAVPGKRVVVPQNLELHEATIPQTPKSASKFNISSSPHSHGTPLSTSFLHGISRQDTSLTTSISNSPIMSPGSILSDSTNSLSSFEPQNGQLESMVELNDTLDSDEPLSEDSSSNPLFLSDESENLDTSDFWD